MEKKLHERLREWANSDCAIELRSVVNAEGCGMYDIIVAIADEIERTYIPLPTDADGNPWCEGDECESVLGNQGVIVGCSTKSIAVRFDNGCVVWYSADDIKRIERDTLERINEDATKEPFAYCVEHRLELSDATDLEESVIAMVRDLLKRQREVLECGE